MSFVPNTSSDDNTPHIAVKKWKYYALLGGIISPTLILLVMFMFSKRLLGGISLGSLYLSNAYPVLILLVTYYIASMRKVGTEQYAGITVFEQPAIECGPGWWFVPLGFAHLRWAPRDIIRMRFPGEPEQISGKPDDRGRDPGQLRPIRIQTGSPKPGNEDDPLNVQMTLEVEFYVRWHIELQYFFDFYARIPGRTWEEEEENIRSQLRDTGSRVIANEFCKGPVASVINELGDITTKLENALRIKVAGWGIVLDEVGLESPDVSHGVASALAGIASARANAKSTVTTSEAEKTRLRNEGEGRAAALIAEAKGREAQIAAEGLGMKTAAEAMGMKPAEYLTAQIARDSLGKGTIILGAPGVRDAVGLGKIVIDSLKGGTDA